MGNYFTINMEANFKKNQDFIQSMNTIKMERQIQLQHQLQERRDALEIAKNRDFCLWFTAFSVVSTIGLFTGFRRTKRPYFLVPLIPFSFITLYSWDLGYGNKRHRLIMEAEHIMTHESELLDVPCGLPTPSSIDQGRQDDEERKKIHPPLEHF